MEVLIRTYKRSWINFVAWLWEYQNLANWKTYQKLARLKRATPQVSSVRFEATSIESCKLSVLYNGSNIWESRV